MNKILEAEGFIEHLGSLIEMANEDIAYHRAKLNRIMEAREAWIASYETKVEELRKDLECKS